MGVGAGAAARAQALRFEFVSRSLIPASAWITVLVALLLTLSLIAWGWRDIWFVITAPAPQGVGSAMLASLALLGMALPVVTVAGFCAAASLWDPRIGGGASSFLLGWLPWATAVPPVIVGCAVYFTLVLLGVPLSLGSGAVGLVLLNTPVACARMLRILRMTPRDLRDAAAAAGADPVFVLFRVSLPRTARLLLGNVAQSGAEMIGQAAVIVLASGVSAANEPLPAQIWHFTPNRALAPVEAAQCIVLLILVLAFALLADGLARRPERMRPEPVRVQRAIKA